jgi:hypothetical protein
MSDTLTHAVAQKVLLADVANILQKAKSGKPLTKYERSVIESAADAPEPDRPTKGTKFQPIRWTIAHASSEFDKHRDTLAKALKRLGILPGEDGMFSTLEIVRACFGDDYIERVDGLRKDNELKDIEIATLRREMLPSDDVVRVWGNIAVAIRQVIKGSSLSDTEKNECFRQLRELQNKDFGKAKSE